MIVAIAGELQMDQPRSFYLYFLVKCLAAGRYTQCYTEYGSEEIAEMNMTESCPEGTAVGEGQTGRGAFQVLQELRRCDQ